MSKTLRHTMAKELAGRFRKEQNFLFVDPIRIAALQADDLRAVLRHDKITLSVLKNSVARVAFKELGLADAIQFINGPTAVVTGNDDAAVMAKRLLAWKGKQAVLEVRGGLISGKKITPDDVKRLAALPTKRELLAHLAGALAAPMSKLAGGMGSLLRGLPNAVNALKDKKEKQPEAAPAAATA